MVGVCAWVKGGAGSFRQLTGRKITHLLRAEGDVGWRDGGQAGEQRDGGEEEAHLRDGRFPS